MEIDSVLAHLSNQDEAYNEKMAFACLSFLANIITLEVVAKAMIKREGSITGVMRCLIESEREDTWHRALYILDELKSSCNIGKILNNTSSLKWT